MAEANAKSGLSIQHLKVIKRRDGEDGRRNTFLGKTSGQAKVKCTMKTLDSVVSKLLVLCDHYFKNSSSTFCK